MNYFEAKRLAVEWTRGIDPEQEGWRSIMALLLTRIDDLEEANSELTGSLLKATRSFPQTVADIIKDSQDKSSW